jgi:hypothetical protein
MVVRLEACRRVAAVALLAAGCVLPHEELPVTKVNATTVADATAACPVTVGTATTEPALAADAARALAVGYTATDCMPDASLLAAAEARAALPLDTATASAVPTTTADAPTAGSTGSATVAAVPTPTTTDPTVTATSTAAAATTGTTTDTTSPTTSASATVDDGSTVGDDSGNDSGDDSGNGGGRTGSGGTHDEETSTTPEPTTSDPTTPGTTPETTPGTTTPETPAVTVTGDATGVVGAARTGSNPYGTWTVKITAATLQDGDRPVVKLVSDTDSSTAVDVVGSASDITGTWTITTSRRSVTVTHGSSKRFAALAGGTAHLEFDLVRTATAATAASTFTVAPITFTPAR